MARPPILQLSEVSLGLGSDRLFDELDLVVQPGDRIALVGRNGSGKSTLMRVMAGLVEPDSGTRSLPPAISVGYMEQEPDFSGHATLGDWATQAVGPEDAWRVEAATEGLALDLARDPDSASGGERRRVALARLMAEAPDLLLLDEPTNHLDISAIGWLEQRLAATGSAFVMISHDRAFLRRLTRATLWLDRGTVRRQDRGFEDFEAWRDKVFAEEDEARHKLDRKIKAEAEWAVEGISARRKRNQGRLRALGDLRAQRRDMTQRAGTAEMALESGPQSGKRVIEAREISKTFGDRRVVAPFSIKIHRGDRIAVVGPNGAGKTTLIRMLTGELPPDSGEVRLGTNLEVAVFDQNRARLDPQMSLWESLTGDAEMRVSGRADQVMVRGQPRHVVGYLKDFLFSEAQARAPVRSLSGGEKARLLLAKIMAQHSNLLVLDEPTNDLDIETLDLLQELLGDYDGTVLLVSHDRDFIDRVASATVLLGRDGAATVHAGGWSDIPEDQRGTAAAPEGRSAAPKSSTPAKPAGKPRQEEGLSFTERHRLDALPGEIERLEAEIAKLSDYLADPDLFSQAPVKFQKATEALSSRQEALAAAEEEWLELEAKAGN